MYDFVVANPEAASYIALISASVSALVSMIFTALINHKFALWRQRREEFNEIADRIDARIQVSPTMAWLTFAQSDIRNFDRRAGFIRRWRFHRIHGLFNEEQQKGKKDPRSGEHTLEGCDLAKMRQLALALRKQVRRK
ncbi:hypothetical protein PHACT_12685 [Pseudohongiella acticola]|uniref:Uncharacterized protein n=1 Tax=Pseudohongiella acticola TaxID=1524254 RepID=A0A1E8CGR8_9GAMM|nr:hypothetical protein PHACT_12685 [Pseudohongiella acticola]